MTDVRPGQLWEDKDKRMAGRRILVGRTDRVYAYCRDVIGGARVRLLLRRMGEGSGTGWRRVKETNE